MIYTKYFSTVLKFEKITIYFNINYKLIKTTNEIYLKNKYRLPTYLKYIDIKLLSYTLLISSISLAL